MVMQRKLNRTITCPLETSQRKTATLRSAVADFRQAAKVTTDLLPSFSPHRWTRNNTQIYRTVTAELPDLAIKDKVVQNAVHRVVENYRSAHELGESQPRGEIAAWNYLCLTSQGYDIMPNDRGYGLKAKFIPYDPEWWHLDIGPHQREYIERALTGDASLGQMELALTDDGPVARISVTWEQSVPTTAEARYVVGVDVGYRTLATAAVYDTECSEIVAVEMWPGHEFRHRREGVQRRLADAKESAAFDRVNALRARQRRYTDHTLHEAAREVVAFASGYESSVLRLEDLTGYRESVAEAEHDWPFNDLQEKLTAKARAAGIGVETVEPYYTSQTCRKCGYRDEDNREESDFSCQNCGYQANADVNAAMNLAKDTT